MNLYVRFCEKCERGYDIGTEFVLCSECRIEKEVENNEGQMGL